LNEDAGMKIALSQRSTRVALALAAALASAHCERTDDAPPAAGVESDEGSAACCVLTPAADLPEGMGRIVVSYPDDGGSGTRLDVYAAGDTSQAIGGGYGDTQIELEPGTYEVTIGGNGVAGVAVQAGHDTRIRAGVLHVYASDATRIDFLDPASGESLTGGYGENSYGFPAGPISVRVAGQDETVLIEDGKVTEF
jgi:hypothetical protein